MRTLLIIIGFVFTITFTSCATRIAVQSPNVKLVKVAQKHHKIVVIKGKRYYFLNSHHYRKTKKGFIIMRI